MTIRRVAIYARVSTKRQHEDNQLIALRKFAKAQGWKIVREYIDKKSGSSEQREALTWMLDDAEAFHNVTNRLFDAVLVFSLSRLTREGPAQTFQYIDRLKRAGVEFWSLTEEYFRTSGPAGQLFISIAAWIASEELRALRERIKAGQARAIAEGKKIGRPRSVDSATRAQIQMFRKQGHSLRVIATKTQIPRATVSRVLLES